MDRIEFCVKVWYIGRDAIYDRPAVQAQHAAKGEEFRGVGAGGGVVSGS